ncbi:MAG: tyrosine-type recombinase/integrase [Oscillospiraceae bacterium]|jgi:site-specific recombinase XerD|nr:tyrosine-type recombinase/integrase [Oscillospiraceae bacterium]
MKREDLAQAPAVLRDYLSYHETIAGHSDKTVDEYFLDLRLFFRFMVKNRHKISVPLEDISITEVDAAFLQSVTLNEVYDFLRYLSRERPKQQNSSHTDYGLTAAARARKVVAIRSFFKYLKKFHIIDENPVSELESPKQIKKLPRYLSLQESLALLQAVEGRHAERDYAILTLFLNCGLRRSELAGLNATDANEEKIRIFGKGGKERELYLNDACRDALNAWLEVRSKETDEKALFISGQGKRMHPNTIHALVKKHLLSAGLDPNRYSTHKLRHTAATLMLSNGVDVRTLQEVLGHEHLNTTQIYTHIDNTELRLAAKANPLSKVKKRPIS